MEVFRVADHRFINDLSGKGAALYGGRWNSKDTYMLYTAESRALALLECLVHLGKLPSSQFCIATIFVPDTAIEVLDSTTLPNDWVKSPPPSHLKNYGDNFIIANTNLALKTPSVIMPEESNYLLNPTHKDFYKVKIVAVRALGVDERLMR